MSFSRTIAIAGILIATATTAAEIPEAQRRSGFSFMTPETQAMQNDDTANPGMLWVLDGEALWKRKAGTADKACADCHGDAAASMKGVAARYPAFDKALGRPVDLEQRINLCRADRQQAAPLALREPRPAGAHRLCCEAIARQPDRGRHRPAARAFHRQGPRALYPATGPAQSRLQQLPRGRLGQAAGGIGDHAGTRHRLPAVPAGMADPRLAAAPPARLHDRHPGAGL